MLRASGDIDELEFALYENWFNLFSTEIPLRGLIYVTTGVNTSKGRIAKRGRDGEDQIPVEYLRDLEEQHKKWVRETPMPVLQLSTEEGVSLEDNIQLVRDFVHQLQSDARKADN
jgi:deoxyadenosine/deoxycytidine kinase